MSSLIEAFTLGNAAILTNACLLPLYPGLIAMLCGTAGETRSRRATALMGLLVLTGVLTMMLLIGLALYVVNQSFGAVLQFLLPAIYALVIVLGVLMLTDRNPFTRLALAQVPIMRNPYATAFVYGLMFGPMTLPCTGPIITSAFIVGAGSTAALADGLLYFLFFGLGFGWPLALLPVAALPVQRRLVGWLARNHLALNRASGILLVAIGVFGIATELLPQYVAGFDLSPAGWFVYWASVAVLIVATAALTIRAGAARPARGPQPDA